MYGAAEVVRSELSEPQFHYANNVCAMYGIKLHLAFLRSVKPFSVPVKDW